MKAAESEKSDFPLSQILLLPFLKLRRHCPLYSHFLSFTLLSPPPPQLSALCCLCPCFHSDTFPTQAQCNQVSGLRVGVGGCRGSGIIRGAVDTRLFKKTDKQDKKSCTDLEEAAWSRYYANSPKITTFASDIEIALRISKLLIWISRKASSCSRAPANHCKTNTSQHQMWTIPKMPDRRRFSWWSGRVGHNQAARFRQFRVIVDRCDINTQQLVAPKLSNSLSIAKLLRCGLTLPARKVRWERSAAPGSQRGFTAVIKRTMLQGGSWWGDEGWNGEFYGSGGRFCRRRARTYVRTHTYTSKRAPETSEMSCSENYNGYN